VPCSLVEVERRFRHVYCLYYQDFFIHLPDNGGSTQLWNVGLLQRDQKALLAVLIDVCSPCGQQSQHFKCPPLSAFCTAISPTLSLALASAQWLSSKIAVCSFLCDAVVYSGVCICVWVVICRLHCCYSMYKFLSSMTIFSEAARWSQV
jgi:hypothetical protein